MDNVLQVHMFGGFSMTWNGQLLTGKTKSSESQFVYLMQLLVHYRDQGVTRDELERVLFEDREIEDIHHATRTVIYNARKRLKSVGLPGEKMIELSEGVYRLSKEIKVETDTERFMNLIREAERSDSVEEQLSIYMDACHAYTGEFLPHQTGMIWVAKESREYHRQFVNCMEQAIKRLRIYQYFLQMEELGEHASKVDPLANWETITMEALVALNRQDEAQHLYEKTVELYMNEQGIRPSKPLLELFEKLGSQMEHQYAVLDDIQRKLSNPDEKGGGYLCTYPAFQGIYRMVERMLERSGQSVFLMLCTVVDSNGVPMKDGDLLDKLALRLGDAVIHSVRRGDAVARYGKGQYLVLLVNISRENCHIVQKRINDRFIRDSRRSGIQYYVNSVIKSADQDDEF